MISMRCFLVPVVMLSLVGASPGTAQDQPERRSIEIALSVPKAEAFNRTMAAFVDQGLVVGHADAASGIVVSVPKTSGGMMTVATVYRANILASGDTASRVILSGGWTSKDVDRLAGEISGSRQPMLRDEKPLSSKMTRTLGEAWKLLEQIASKVRPTQT